MAKVESKVKYTSKMFWFSTILAVATAFMLNMFLGGTELHKLIFIVVMPLFFCIIGLLAVDVYLNRKKSNFKKVWLIFMFISLFIGIDLFSSYYLVKGGLALELNLFGDWFFQKDLPLLLYSIDLFSVFVVCMWVSILPGYIFKVVKRNVYIAVLISYIVLFIFNWGWLF